VEPHEPGVGLVRASCQESRRLHAARHLHHCRGRQPEPAGNLTRRQGVVSPKDLQEEVLAYVNPMPPVRLICGPTHELRGPREEPDEVVHGTAV
jgi:hypothetical protein